MDFHNNNHLNQSISVSIHDEQDNREQTNNGILNNQIQRYNFDIMIENQHRRAEPHMHVKFTGIDNINIIN